MRLKYTKFSICSSFQHLQDVYTFAQFHARVYIFFANVGFSVLIIYQDVAIFGYCSGIREMLMKFSGNDYLYYRRTVLQLLLQNFSEIGNFPDIF